MVLGSETYFDYAHADQFRNTWTVNSHLEQTWLSIYIAELLCVLYIHTVSFHAARADIKEFQTTVQNLKFSTGQNKKGEVQVSSFSSHASRSLGQIWPEWECLTDVLLFC